MGVLASEGVSGIIVDDELDVVNDEDEVGNGELEVSDVDDLSFPVR